MGALVAGPALDVVGQCVYFISKPDNGDVYTINLYRYVSGHYATLSRVSGATADESLQDVISMAFDSVGGKLYWANDRGPRVRLFYVQPYSKPSRYFQPNVLNLTLIPNPRPDCFCTVSTSRVETLPPCWPTPRAFATKYSSSPMAGSTAWGSRATRTKGLVSWGSGKA